MIQRMSDQHKIKFLNNKISNKDVKDVEKASKKTIEQIAEEQKARKISNKNDKYKTVQHISSARTGEISDQGGPSKYIKSESSNIIWDSERTKKQSEEIDNKTKTMQDKEQIASNRREMEKQRMDTMAQTLKSTIQDKASSVSSAGTLEGTNYKLSNNGMSIFDNKDFMRLQEKTGGEQISEDIQKRKEEIDDSWRSGGKAFSSKDMTQKLFDGLFQDSEK